ncbi:hypothetical protein ACH4E7_36310, partial [Kitasatospora sp. NPDC018058]|uniref:hypothetical protein n=1 Tax=Kitasatospora sp. NPDC018058 TaxID=3364025 RepID=UPI0037BFB120
LVVLAMLKGSPVSPIQTNPTFRASQSRLSERACTDRLPDDLRRAFQGDSHEFLHWQDEYRRDTEQWGSSSYTGG